MPIYLLLAMQAAGMVVDYFGTRNQDELMKMGMKIQQAGIEAELEMTRLESQDSSLQAMKKLRQTMGTQIATMAARGTAAGAGSALSLLNESVGNFNADERIRKLNLLARENRIKAGSVLSKLQYSADSSQLWQGFAQRTINRVTSGASGFQGASKGASQGFGLTSAAGA